MKFTKIKSMDHKPVNLGKLTTELVTTLAKKGFVTGIDILSETSFKLGLHGRSFNVNIKKIGANLRRDHSRKSITGWKRTNVPTWDQRVEYNQTVQELFDKYNLSAKITSGQIVVRDGVENLTESDWNSTVHADSKDTIQPMYDAYVTEEKEARKARAKELAAEKRARMCNAEKFITDIGKRA